MRTLTHMVEHCEAVRIWFLTDLHLGARGCNEDLLRAHIQRIALDERAYWIGGGDYVDAITHLGDKRYRPETIAAWALGRTDVVQAQRDYVLELLAPIAHKCLGMAAGNHEWQTDRRYGSAIYADLVRAVAERKGVASDTLALGAQGFVQLTWRLRRRWVLTIFVHHGYGGGRLAGGDALALQRMLHQYDCDLLFVGHRHTLLVLNRHLPVAGGKVARLRESWGIFMPGYLDPYLPPSETTGMPIDTYPEEKALPPRGVGAFPVEADPQRRVLRLQLESAPLDGRRRWRGT